MNKFLALILSTVMVANVFASAAANQIEVCNTSGGNAGAQLQVVFSPNGKIAGTISQMHGMPATGSCATIFPPNSNMHVGIYMLGADGYVTEVLRDTVELTANERHDI